jgi:hypothetical protein
MHGALAVALVALWPFTAVAQQRAVEPDVDLKLFEKGEADRSRGCTVTLWQADRDPDRDRYAISFIEQLYGRDNLRQPARIKIGAAVIPLQRVAVGGKTEGYGVYPYQLYRMPDDGNFVVLDLKAGGLEGEAIDITTGTMTIIMRGSRVFRQTVKGGAGCMGAPLTAAQAQAAAPASVARTAAPAATAPPPTTSAPARPPAPPVAAPAAAAPRATSPAAVAAPHEDEMRQATPVTEPYRSPGMFTRYAVRPQQIPRALITRLERAFSCSPDMIRTGTVGFQMSEESAIWEVPCERFAYQANSIFIQVYLPDPTVNLSFLQFDAPKGKTRSAGRSTLLNAQWDVRTRTVSSFAMGRGQGDCGTYERHRVMEDASFQLVEYREKAACDGVMVKPEAFPLVYRAR